MKEVLLILLTIIFYEFGYSQCRIDYSNYELVFEETFDNISSINDLRPVWQFKHDDPGWGWGDETDPSGNVLHGEHYEESQLSLLPGGFLRLTAQAKEQPFPAVWSNWLGANRFPKYVSGMIQLRTDLLNDPRFDVVNNQSGFVYGMFEIRLKLPPSQECFPSFWLTRAGCPTEIDFFEYGEDNRVISNNLFEYTPTVTNSCAYYAYKTTGNSLEQDFHIIQGVWTPTEVTFFIDNKEVRTVSSNQIMTHNNCVQSIVVNLAMRQRFGVNMNYMDIDYIRVYKPQNNDYTLPYKSSSEYVHNYVLDDITPSAQTVSSEPNSIAVNPNDPNEVFYRGSDDYIYQAVRSNGSWNVTQLQFNDGPPVLAAGDIRYMPQFDQVIYVGQNNRINAFVRDAQSPSGFYHWYISSNPSCYWCVTNDKIASTEGSLTVADNGEIFYRGFDNKLHQYASNTTNWVHQILPSTYNLSNPVDFVTGDIVVDPLNNSNSVFYRGNDGRLQIFYKVNGAYQHGWIDNNFSQNDKLINSSPGSMVWSVDQNGVLYVGTDNKLHLYNWNGAWGHLWIPHNYGSSSLGYPNADLLKPCIDWNDHDKMLTYIGFDGRMQHFRLDQNTLTWTHGWIDDYWNTSLFHSYSDINMNKNASTRIGPDNSIFYSKNNGNISYFKYEPCENLDPACSVGTNLNGRILFRTTSVTNVSDRSQEKGIIVSPNPASNSIRVTTNELVSTMSISIYDITGKLWLYNEKYIPSELLDISSLPKGVYVVNAKYNDKSSYEKIVIE